MELRARKYYCVEAPLRVGRRGEPTKDRRNLAWIPLVLLNVCPGHTSFAIFDVGIGTRKKIRHSIARGHGWLSLKNVGRLFLSRVFESI